MIESLDSEMLSVKSLVKNFGGVRAVNEVSFEVQRSEILAIIGPNGAGKTSLFNCLNGVYTPEQGSMLFQGKELVGMAPHKIANLGISRTFQNLALFNNLSVLDSLMLGRHSKMKAGMLSGMFWFGQASKEEYVNRTRCLKFVEILELEPYISFPVGLLPYGIQKQIELGRALVAEPDLLLLDEPVSGLNAAESQKIAEILLRVKAELDLTILIVEHDMTFVGDVCDRVVVMNFGEVIASGSPAEVSCHPLVLEAYLGAKTK